jgi:hypothetical protein
VLSGLKDKDFSKVKLAESGSWSCQCHLTKAELERNLSKRKLLAIYR